MAILKSKVIFQGARLKKELLQKAVAEQTRRLATYARDELYEMIAMHEFVSRTFNLVDSYVWAVYYQGKLQRHGFLGGKLATQDAILHEWGKVEDQVPVNGRQLAQDFLEKFKSQTAINGWTVVWAACAPYSIYLDPAAGATRTNHFYVISQEYDQIRGTLGSKCHVEFKTTY